MALWRESLAGFLAASFSWTPFPATANPPLGMVLSASRAHIGATDASAGASVFGGDQLTTEQNGKIQVRIGAARLLLGGSSRATLHDADGPARATLLSGTAVFSAAAKAFTLLVARAEIRPRDDAAAVAQVSIETSKQFVVRSTRGALTITVDGETQIIPEGAAYRVTLDPDAESAPMSASQGPRGSGTRDFPSDKKKTAKSNFYRVVVIGAGVATYFAVDEAFESPDKP